MTPAETYEKYLALKLHFTTDTYDVFKYDWKTRANYQGRKDKLQFERLSRHKDPVGLMISTFLETNQTWVGDILDGKHQEAYLDWKRRRDGIHYVFEQEVNLLNENSFKVEDGQHPELLKLYLKQKVSPETMVILDHYVHYSDVWNKKLKDDVYWRELGKRIAKYKGFVKYDRTKTHKIMLDKFRPT